MEGRMFSDIEKQKLKERNREIDKIYRETCDAMNHKMDEILKCLIKKNSILTFDSLKKIPVNEMYKLDKGIHILKLEDTKNSIVFETYMEPKTSLSLHSHDCFEVIQVIYGHLKDDARGPQIYESGDRLIYNKLEKHQPKADVKSKYIVSFIK